MSPEWRTGPAQNTGFVARGGRKTGRLQASGCKWAQFLLPAGRDSCRRTGMSAPARGPVTAARCRRCRRCRAAQSAVAAGTQSRPLSDGLRRLRQQRQRAPQTKQQQSLPHDHRLVIAQPDRSGGSGLTGRRPAPLTDHTSAAASVCRGGAAGYLTTIGATANTSEACHRRRS